MKALAHDVHGTDQARLMGGPDGGEHAIQHGAVAGKRREQGGAGVEHDDRCLIAPVEVELVIEVNPLVEPCNVA